MKRKLLIKGIDKISSVVFGVLWLLGFTAVSGFAAGEFTPDANTLFLAHYNTSLDADYSQGAPKHDSLDTGYLTKGNNGYFGEGLAARVGAAALKEAGADISGSSLMPAKDFDGIRYAAPGNLDLVKGTFECWYKPYCSAQRAKDMPEGWPLEYFIFGYTETNGRYLITGINSYLNNINSFFYGIVAGEDIVIINRGIDWKPGTWHHVAITWDTTDGPGNIALFLDGNFIYRMSLAPLKGKFLKQTGEIPYFSIGSPVWRKSGNPLQFNKADGIIDEVRISNAVRYTENFKLPEKP